MRTQSNVVTVTILIIATSLSLQAKPASKGEQMIVHVTQENQHSIKVQLANLEKKRTLVQIIDIQGKIWLSDYARGVNGYSKMLDLDEIPTGQYVLQVKNMHKRYIQVFTKIKGNVFFFEKENTTPRDRPIALFASNNPVPGDVLISRIKSNSEYTVDIQLANLLGATSTVQLKSIRGSIIYQEIIKGRNGYAKTINLQDVLPGEYYFLIQTSSLTQILFLTISKHGIELKERQKLDSRLTSMDLAIK